MRRIIFFFLVCITGSIIAQNNNLGNELSRVDNLINKGQVQNGIDRLYQMRDSICSIPNFELQDYFGVVNSLVAYLPGDGQLAKLDDVINEAMNVCKHRQDADTFLAYLYASKSQMYGDLLDFDQTIYSALEGLRICEKYNLRDMAYILLLGNAAYAYSALGDLLSSKLYGDEAIAEIERDSDSQQNQTIMNIYGFLLNNSAINDYRAGRLKDAELTFKKILKYINSQDRPDSPYQFALNNLAGVLLYQGKYKEAIDILDKIPINNYRTAIFKVENTLTAHVLLDDEEVLQSLINYSDVQHKTLFNVLGNFSESERDAFLKQRLRELSVITNYATLACGNDDMRRLAFNDNLFARSANPILTKYVNSQLDNDPRTKLIRDSIVSKEYDLSRRADWLTKLKQSENAILRSTTNLDTLISAQAGNFEETKSYLGKDDAYILFCYTPIIKDLHNPIPGYGAYIVKPNSTSPELIFLCNVDSVEEVFYNTTPDPEFISELYSSEKAKRLHGMLWEKLEPSLNGIKNVFYSVSGPLSTINFDALIAENGKRLRDLYNLKLVSIPQVIRGIDEKFNDGTSFVAFGSPAFNISNEDMLANAEGYSKYSGEDISDELALRGELLRGNWLDIPGTQKEVESISSMMKNKVVPIKTYFGKDASEEAFKSLDGQSPQIIHIATHGFVISTDNQYDNNLFAQSLGGITERGTYMLWTGLVFAGGNNTWKGEKLPEGVEDGILTAAEISRMNLSGTDLVVLSACETARGHIDPVEGVWGLQRAFKDAGVKTILMTLWKVPDSTTAMFMEEFYKNLNQGKTVRQSVRAAQDHLIKNGISDPYYWAPFVVLD